MSYLQDAETSDGALQLLLLPDGQIFSDEPPLESDLHFQQIALLWECLDWFWRDRQDYYAAGNMTVYYSPEKITTREFRGPDFFVALDTVKHPRTSWVIWNEGGKFPNVIIELLSDSTARTDRGPKKLLYQDRFQTPEYFWFNPWVKPRSRKPQEFRGFRLIDGRYIELLPDANGWLWSQELQLYLGIHHEQLRYFTPQGELVPTRGEWEMQRADLEMQRAERLAEKLRELGVDPTQL
jgi:Uma2 family endonuclease